MNSGYDFKDMETMMTKTKKDLVLSNLWLPWQTMPQYQVTFFGTWAFFMVVATSDMPELCWDHAGCK